MGRVTRAWCGALLLVAAAATGEDRLAVLEFFGRPAGQFCQEAAPAVIQLQGEMEGRALLLEYDYDDFRSGRVDRWWDAYPGGGTVYLPLVMVGSGFRISMGPVDHYFTYRSMLEAELMRPPAAEVEAYSRRMGQVVRVYVRVENTGGATIRPEDDASVWVVLWEDARRGLTDTWVQATAVGSLTAPLEPGAEVTMTLDVTPISAVDWGLVRSLALVEHRPEGGTYDMLQAAVTVPATLGVTPDELTLTASNPSAEVRLEGPHVLTWSVAVGVPWLEVRPTAGSLPATVTVNLLADAVPPGPQEGLLTFDARGDGMSWAASVTVSAEGPADPYAPRRVRGRFGSPGGEVVRP